MAFRRRDPRHLAADDLTTWQNHGSLTADRPDMEVEVPIAPATPRHFLRVRALR